MSSASATTLPAVWVNGVPVSADAAAVSARDRGLTLADGVFETMRAHHGRIFRLDRHLARLEHALARLEIPSSVHLRRWLDNAVAALAGSTGSLRLTVTRGIAAGGVRPPPDPHPTVIITVGPLPQVPAAVYEQGLTAHVASGRRNERAMTAGLKTTAYTDAVLALIEARKTGADEALFLDTDGHCSEATASNLFVCNGGRLITPPVTCGALPGITRGAIMELAAAAGMQVSERAIVLDELITADEAFLTSSLRGVAPLVRVGGSRIGAGTPGALTARLTAAYTALVDRECGASTRNQGPAK